MNSTAAPDVTSLNASTATNYEATVPTSELFENGTGFFVDEDFDSGLNDWETLFLSSFITLLPLFVALLVGVAIRLAWLKYKRRRNRSDSEECVREDSTEVQARPLHSHLLNSDTDKVHEAHVSIATEELDVAEAAPINHSTTNGSIITMTLKNNHLIVEKEERSDIEEDSRETTVRYSPNAKDGVFIVEVQQGMKRSPVSSQPSNCLDKDSTSDQCAVVHNPPERYSDEETMPDDTIETTSATIGTPESYSAHQIQTGLSQSSQSITSPHYSYCYGNQQSSDCGSYGYDVYRGYSNKAAAPPERKKPILDPRKPKIAAALYKNRTDTLDFDPSSDGPLLSDVMASERVEENVLTNGCSPETGIAKTKEVVAAKDTREEAVTA